MATSTGLPTTEYSDLPAVLVVVDDEAAGATARSAVAEAGGRVSATVSPDAALDRIDAQVSLAAVVMDVRTDNGAALDRLFARVERGAGDGKFAGVVTVSRELIDAASAALAAAAVTLLCEPTAIEREAAITQALARRPLSLADIGPGLKELADEVARIAKTLASLASEDAGRGPLAGNRPAGGQTNDAAMIRAMIRARRLRGQFFPAELFADPAWDMLLDLTAARLEGRAVAVSSLCIASAVPPTTALRWIKTLTDGKLFERVADSTDGRRVFIELTEVAESGMRAYLVQLQRILTLHA